MRPRTQQLEVFAQLVEVIEKLRAPDGCPWDRQQSPASLKKYLLEEAGELAEAIDNGDTAHICEETGDLLYILLLLARIHEEEDGFSLQDAIAGITAKMIRRHPHVFAGVETGSDSELRRQWKQIKAAEKTCSGSGEQGG